MSARLRISLLAAAALLLAPGGLLASDARVESRLEPRVIGLDGYALFTLEVSGSGWTTPRLTPAFELQNLEIAGGPDQRHDVTLGTGGSHWHYAWTWQLRPRSVGSAAVTSIRVQVGDDRLDLAPRRLEVRRHAPPAPPGAPGAGRPPRAQNGRSLLEELLRRGLGGGAPGDRDLPDVGGSGEAKLFLRAVADPVDPYVGQRVLYTVYLYTQMDVRAMDPESLPRFQGLWARTVDLGDPPREQVIWQGETYTRVALLQKELYSLAAGTRELEPVRAHFLVERIARDRFFLAPLRVPAELERRSNPVHLRVKPLPPPSGPIAARFGGAVGKITARATMAPRQVAVGQGATLSLTLAGDGDLESLPAPDLDLPPGLEVLESEAGPAVPAPPPAGAEAGPAADEAGREAQRSAGMTRTWRYVVVPRRSGSWRLPAVEVAYFDPEAGRYRTARAPLPELVAGPAAVAARGAERSGSGLHAIRNAALPPRPAPRWRLVLPWAFAVPWLMAFALLLGRRREANGDRSGGSRAESAEFLAALGEARTEERPRRAAAAIERAWRGLLRDAWGLDDAGAPARWPAALAARGVPADACGELAGLLEDLHYLRYAPELSATSDLAGELVARSERLERALTRDGARGRTRGAAGDGDREAARGA